MEDPMNVTVAILASVKFGYVFVPLDVRTPERRREKILQLVKPPVTVTDLAHTDNARPDGCIVEWRVGSATVGTEEETYQWKPDDLAYIFFTSGSTGEPKGIAGRYESIWHFIDWEIATLGVAAGCRVSQLTSPGFDVIMRDLFVPLATGGCICIPPEGIRLAETRSLVEWISTSNIQLIHCVPSLFRTFLGVNLDETLFPDLQYILLAGEPLLSNDIERWMRIFGSRVQLMNIYGPTETTLAKMFHRVTAENRTRLRVPVGRPIPGCEVYVRNDDGTECRAGEVGEIYLRTRYRSLGYFNDREATAAAFLPFPGSSDPSDVVYKTGDLGALLENGELEILGRRDSQVKVRGVRIELLEIENALRKCESVFDAAVTVKADAAGYQYLAAYVVSSRAVRAEDLRRELAAEIPDYMMPSRFVHLKELPRTITGKIDRITLSKTESVDTPQLSREDLPRGKLESAVAAMFAEILVCRPVGRHENFFDLGGHSLSAAMLVQRIHDALDVQVPVKSLFEFPTPCALAAALGAESGTSGASEVESGSLVEQLNQTGSRPPFIFLHSALVGEGFYGRQLAQYLGSDQPFCNVAPLGLDGREVPGTVEEIAAVYVRAVRERYPRGPYILGGFCMSGVVAFEMARQLRRSGHEVPLVVVIEAEVQNVSLRARVVGRTVNGLGRLIGVPARRRAMLFLALKGRGKEQSLWREPPRGLTRDRVNSAYERAKAAYVPQRTATPLLCLHARSTEQCPGWRHLTWHYLQDVLPGDHNTCVTAHLRETAAVLKRYIDRE